MKEETKLRFKVGDKVRITSRYNRVILPSKHGYDIGEVVQIKESSIRFPDNPYWTIGSNGGCWWVGDSDIESIEKTEPARKIKGYRLKEECKQYSEALNVITNNSLSSCIYGNTGYNFAHNSDVYDRANTAGVMHWFEPVYEEPEFTAKKGEWVVITEWGEACQGSGYFKLNYAYQLSRDLNPSQGFFTEKKTEWLNENGWESAFKLGMKFRHATPSEIQKAKEGETKVITMRCEGGTFEIEVSKNGIYYRPEDAFLAVSYLKDAIRMSSKVVGQPSKIYLFKPSHVDSGCRKQVPVSDWEKVIEEYERICKS